MYIGTVYMYVHFTYITENINKLQQYEFHSHPDENKRGRKSEYGLQNKFFNIHNFITFLVFSHFFFSYLNVNT